MLDYILNQGLDRQRGDRGVIERGRDGDFEANAVTESGSLYFKIIADNFEFLAEWDEAGVVGIEREAQ